MSNQEEKPEKTQEKISVPVRTADRLRKHVPNSGYNNPSALATHILNGWMEEQEKLQGGAE